MNPSAPSTIPIPSRSDSRITSEEAVFGTLAFGNAVAFLIVLLPISAYFQVMVGTLDLEPRRTIASFIASLFMSAISAFAFLFMLRSNPRQTAIHRCKHVFPKRLGRFLPLAESLPGPYIPTPDPDQDPWEVFVTDPARRRMRVWRSRIQIFGLGFLFFFFELAVFAAAMAPLMFLALTPPFDFFLGAHATTYSGMWFLGTILRALIMTPIGLAAIWIMQIFIVGSVTKLVPYERIPKP